jgi:hypothetical protein
VRLVNRQLSRAQSDDFGFVVVGTGDLVPDFREASSSYESNVSTTNYRNSQDSALLIGLAFRSN